MYRGLQVKYPLFFSDFKETWIFLDRFSKNIQKSNFIKNASSVSQFFPCGHKHPHIQTDGQTDMTKPIVAFRNLQASLKVKAEYWLQSHSILGNLRDLDVDSRIIYS